MTLLYSLFVFVSVLLIITILLQPGSKGGGLGAAFGGGASGSLFGASGSANFLSRTTAVLATVFFITSLTLTYLASHRTTSSSSVMEGVAPTAVQSAVVPAPAQSKPVDVPK